MKGLKESEFQYMIQMILIVWGISFLYIRSVLSSVKELYLKRRECENRKRNQTFKDWFLYTRYRDTIPKILLRLYFIIIVIHPLIFLLAMLCLLIEDIYIYVWNISKGVFIFDAIYFWIITLLSFNPKSPWADYKRWIKWRNPKKK